MVKTYNTKEVMKILHIKTPRIVYGMFERGEIRGMRSHLRGWICTEDNLMDYIHRQEEKARDEYQGMVGGA